MNTESFLVESVKPFSESLIWQLNRDFYQEQGIKAWSEGTVPHNLTSNSRVGKTYAELILAFLKDLAFKGQTKETVYILELGAGHGRLAYHILKHLEKLESFLNAEIPPYCFILSDIAEDNLKFFIEHPQLQEYLGNGKLEVAYFDGSASQEIHLRHSDKVILPKSLNQPIIALANYFFDSIPTDLFLIQNEVISACSIELHSKMDPNKVDTSTLINNLDVKYYSKVLSKPYYEESILNEILEDYKSLVSNTYLYFPHHSLRCIANLKEISAGGLMVLSMDKGFHEIPDIDNKQPDIVAHGSLSLWVNYHALGAYCEKQGGKAYFPSFSTFHLDIACLLFLPETDSFIETNLSYQKVVNDFGPDEFNSLKKMAYFNVAKLTITEIIALVRMSAYDSSFFIKLLPKLKQVFLQTTEREQKIIVQTLEEVWKMYFNINENYDLAYEIGGMYYDLADYPKALDRFQNSSDTFGHRADIYYNQALCYYQLRQDELFLSTLKEGKEKFPNNEMFVNLDKLDMSAK